MKRKKIGVSRKIVCFGILIHVLSWRQQKHQCLCFHYWDFLTNFWHNNWQSIFFDVVERLCFSACRKCCIKMVPPLGAIHLRRRQIFTIFDPYPLKMPTSLRWMVPQVKKFLFSLQRFVSSATAKHSVETLQYATANVHRRDLTDFHFHQFLKCF